ncbi:glutathione S-transferase [Congregibacter variabilis]|uniref:Glutathione S-transferase n=1 Tax=Congregibacter variabilis TaxID=3081200 RepID=A0ABZ0I5Q8_9GAMM|nr:glutathione S-transferase [Congregibacter sp. IMCC43200]
MQSVPILYSFRRCPYAMRARMALSYAGVRVELREVVLKDKPSAMLEASPKGTVPVLILPGGRVIDESIDVMFWALRQRDQDHWLTLEPGGKLPRELIELIAENDGSFKGMLDKYKYADRHPQQSADWYREQACVFLGTLETRLSDKPWLHGSQLGFADVAIFPFIRQFAMVDRPWFDQTPYSQLRRWLDDLLGSELFTSVMHKHPKWTPEQSPLWFPEDG